VTGSGNSLSPSFLTTPFGFLPHRKICRALRDEWVTGASDGSIAKLTGHTRYCGNFLFIPAIEFGQNIFCNRAARPDLRATSEYGNARIDV
jgi:hypothetical protein